MQEGVEENGTAQIDDTKNMRLETKLYERPT
jgi:hypothetical protein